MLLYMSMTFSVAISPLLSSFTSVSVAFFAHFEIHVGTIQWLVMFLFVGGIQMH
jgi:hypothetical protein